MTNSLTESPAWTKESLEKEVQEFIRTHFSEEDREEMNPAWSDRVLNKIKSVAGSTPAVKRLEEGLRNYLPYESYLLMFIRDILVLYCDTRQLAVA